MKFDAAKPQLLETPLQDGDRFIAVPGVDRAKRNHAAARLLAGDGDGVVVVGEFSGMQQADVREHDRVRHPVLIEQRQPLRRIISVALTVRPAPMREEVDHG